MLTWYGPIHPGGQHATVTVTIRRDPGAMLFRVLSGGVGHREIMFRFNFRERRRPKKKTAATGIS
jgi:hypothetical protein